MFVVGYVSRAGRDGRAYARRLLGMPGDVCETPLVAQCRRCDRSEVWSCGNHRESKCRPCAKRYQRRLRRIAEAGMMARAGGYLYMLTMTAPGASGHVDPSTGTWCRCTPEHGVDLARWNASHSARWNRFRTALKRNLPELQYIRGIEVQRRGALHDHAVVWSPVPLRLRELRQLAIDAGFGHSMTLQRSQPGSRKFAWYVSKYITKACDQRDSVPWLTDLVDDVTGELTEGPGPARYRTWSMSRDWGMTMTDARAICRDFVARREAAGYAATLELLAQTLGAGQLAPAGADPP